MAKLLYPLEQVIDVKKKRVEDAEKALAAERKHLEAEEKKLKERETERDKALQHNQDKINQLRKTLDGGTNTHEVQQMKRYIDVTKEKLEIEERKVEDQKEQVKAAEKKVEQAKLHLKKKKQEVDKLEEHKIIWFKEKKREIELEEIKEQDELGNAMFLTNLIKKQRQ